MKMLFQGIKVFKAKTNKQKTTLEKVREKLTVYEYAMLRAEMRKELSNTILNK